VEDEMRPRVCWTEAGFQLYWIMVLGRGRATVTKEKTEIIRLIGPVRVQHEIKWREHARAHRDAVGTH